MKKSNLVKRNMKTLGALMMVAAMAVGMTACSSKEDDNKAMATFTPTESSQETKSGTPETAPGKTLETTPETAPETSPVTTPTGEEAFVGQITSIEGNKIVLVKGDTKASDTPTDLSGEKVTIDITENTIIIAKGEEAAVADLGVDDIVTVVMDGDVVNSITVGASV